MSVLELFCCVDDLLMEITQGHPIRYQGFAPALADSEVIGSACLCSCNRLDKKFPIYGLT